MEESVHSSKNMNEFNGSVLASYSTAVVLRSDLTMAERLEELKVRPEQSELKLLVDTTL